MAASKKQRVGDEMEEDEFDEEENGVDEDEDDSDDGEEAMDEVSWLVTNDNRRLCVVMCICIVFGQINISDITRFF